MKEYIEPTEANIQMILGYIADFAKNNNFVVKGDLKLTGEIKFPSWNQRKVLRNFLTRLNRKMTRSQANRFLHALSKFVDGFSAKVELSDFEIAIQKARKDWKEARDKADQLLKSYKEKKEGFYKVMTKAA